MDCLVLYPLSAMPLVRAKCETRNILPCQYDPQGIVSRLVTDTITVTNWN